MIRASAPYTSGWGIFVKNGPRQGSTGRQFEHITPGFILTGGNIFSLDFFRVVKPISSSL